MNRIRRGLALVGMMLLGMTLGAFILAFLLAGEIYEYQDTFDGAHLPEIDAIVCLAGGRGRISAAGDLWYRYWESRKAPGAEMPVLYISGMGHQAKWPALTRQLRRGVTEVIKPENVVMETESFNTDANARWLVRFAKQKGWDRILLITSPYHMKRARFIFEKTIAAAGIPVGIETLSVYQEPFEPGEWRSGFHGIRVTVTEYLKWIWYQSVWRPTPPF